MADLVNESLERAARDPGAFAGGAVRDTSDGADAAAVRAVPEHSTPASGDGYAALRTTFTAPELPYDQPVDVNRSYLRHLRTSRFETMRNFRRDITELVLDPAAEPDGFQRHLWRYPVRTDIAREYLGITAREYDLLYTRDAGLEPQDGRLTVRELFGFASEMVGEQHWTDIVLQVPEFLRRTGLDYCELRELSECRYVPFGKTGGFPECEACDLTGDRIELEDDDRTAALRRLAVFIRLWRTLRSSRGGGHGFPVLRDICEVLGLFDENGNIAPGFVRQLAALQMLLDDFGPPLTDGTAAGENATGAARTHLLALWAGPGTPRWEWARDRLIEAVQRYATHRHRCDVRPSGFTKLLAENLDALSVLAGFDPGADGDTWHARPAHTLRFAEVLAKVYASDFGVGEVLYLFDDAHLDGEDPFPLQPGNEALDSPLGLPDDDREFSLWRLRLALRDAEVADGEVRRWTWPRIESAMRDRFGLQAQPGAEDPLRAVGEHCFPSVLEAAGHTVPPQRRQYRTDLGDTAPRMWNTPHAGPFRYDTGAKQLWSQLPLSDEAVIEKLCRLRRLNDDEQAAVKRLYFMPRADLAPLAFLFADFTEAEERLLQEPDEQSRWDYFQRSFALAHTRCELIAEHLAGHVTAWTGRERAGTAELAWQLLRRLFADENRGLTPWEDDSGAPPAVTWPDQPSGGAFAALLGLTGTGALGELRPDGGPAGWREVRGRMAPFGTAQNARNAPVPTIVPSMGLTLTHAQQQYAAVRNGFALADPNGAVLGGAQGYTAVWTGELLIERHGEYEFLAGAPAAEGEPPGPDAFPVRRWRVRLRRGRQVWTLLSHAWAGESAPPGRSAPVRLRQGTYRVTVELAQPAPAFAGTDDLHTISGGLQIAYARRGDDGRNDGERPVTIPVAQLFRDRKDGTLADGLDNVENTPQRFLTLRYTSTLRDIRRTYQRAFKAMLFVHRFGLSAEPESDDGQSEIGHLLAHASDFAGRSYHRDDRGFGVHHAHLDFNLLPVDDNYHRPTPDQDLRAAPSVRRRTAMFDWWERIFDYTMMRESARTAPERPVWLLFHEAAENHPDDPAQLVWYLGVGIDHHGLVTRYFADAAVTTDDLVDERWPLRVWRADAWVRALRRNLSERDIREARPDLWAADDPGAVPADGGEPGDANLMGYVRDGCLGSGEPRRYADLRSLNDGLRERGRHALLAYLCGMDRLPLPQGGQAGNAADLTDLLLLDVEAGYAESRTRVAEAIGAVQTFVQRARLGLEPGWQVPPAFVQLWDRRFASHRVWAADQRRTLYREDWIDWDELEEARDSEAFRLLENGLRRSAVAIPAGGGQVYLPGERPDNGLTLMQDEPSRLRRLSGLQGFTLGGTPELHARPSWLATSEHRRLSENGTPPLWIQAAVRLGSRFVRVAAAGPPQASARFTTRPDRRAAACCAECGGDHPAMVDEYYFWLVDARRYTQPDEAQNAAWSWDDPRILPGLLRWDSKPGVRLAWCRVHNGEFGQPRCSADLVATTGAPPGLLFHGRRGDSLTFEVMNAVQPVPGHDASVPPGFRYDLPDDQAAPLPPLPHPTDDEDDGGGDAQEEPSFLGRLAAFPYFAYEAPGAPLTPRRPFAPAVAMAGHLRSHCRFEAALRAYETSFAPLRSDATWSHDGTAPAEDEFRRRAITLHYLETLVSLGDAALREGTAEAAQRARLVYGTAARILGPRPRRVVLARGRIAKPMTVEEFEPEPARLNPRLLGLYETTADRLDRVRRVHATTYATPHPTGPDAGPGTADELCLEEDEWCAQPSPYRFTILLQRAQQLTAEVRGLGAALLSAHEKGDAEYLASVRATHERELLNLALDVRKQQWREADWQFQALQATREMTQARFRYYVQLLQSGLNNREAQHGALTNSALSLRAGGSLSEGIGQAFAAVPDQYVGFPSNFVELPIGTKISQFFAAIARVHNTTAEIGTTTAGLRVTESGWERRADEWQHQKEVLELELKQVARQIRAAERRRDISLRELNHQRRQIEHSAEIHDFLRDRFTSSELYLWLQQETTALHAQTYELALHAARQAEAAFRYERGHTRRSFVPPDPAWDDLHQGLQSGERLALALHQMEQAYSDTNEREYELTKRISLRTHFPLQFLRLKATGRCEFDIAEWMLDQDFPGHYHRLISHVAVTAPCVTSPYTGVHCRLSLLGSSTRVSPALAESAACCPDGAPGRGYLAAPGDPRVRHRYIAGEAIATSTGQENETGLFELNFRDERRLPFAFAGAVSRWRVELPPGDNHFDLGTLSDFVLTLNYTAREGGEALREAAAATAGHHLPGEGVRYFDIQHDMPDAWTRLRPAHGERPRELPVVLSRGMFPFVAGPHGVRVNRIDLFVEADDAVPGAHRLIRFAETGGQQHRIRCVAGDDWPGFFHGVLDDIALWANHGRARRPQGTFRLPDDLHHPERVFMICSYELTPRERPAPGLSGDRPRPED
ncbi:neuraminidase-like domain-containing protein [Actinomadura sp. SCN-SB]|uniref:Tc toxin subunit A-related protein n=1 Tax=Actinomadura sp. SCN-SB TaxID=3373092 RepID=UPI003753A3BF